MEDKNKLFRASTAHVDISQLQNLLLEENVKLAEAEGEVGETCEYDLTRHVISYLPTPSAGKNAADRSKMMQNGKGVSKKNMTDNMNFLGVMDGDDHRGSGGSDYSKSMMTGLSNEDISSDPNFHSMFRPKDMRLLALVSHNNMKQSMKQFVLANMNVLKKFRLTGTNTTMSMLREVFGKDPDVSYGPSCKSGPLGGDAQLVAMAVTGQLGGCIFFIDPMDSHPHSADIECLVRQGNVHNILMMNNPCTAHVSMNTFRIALKMGRMEMIPSFFFDMESPSVEAYKQRQNAVLENAISRRASIVVQNVTTVLVPTRENKVNLAMKRANDKRVSFVMDGKIPTFDEEDDEESYEDDGQQRESFLPKSGQKTKFNIFNMFGMCCEA